MIYLKLFMTAVFWGGTFIAGRVVAANGGPYSASFIRFAVATLLLLGLWVFKSQRLPSLRAGQWVAVASLGLTGVFAYNVFFFKGLEWISAGRAALIIALNPIFITLFSALFFRDRLTIRKMTGITVSVLGAMIAISQGDLLAFIRQGPGLGEVYILGCVLSWVAFSLIGKAVLGTLSPLSSVTLAALFGVAALAIPALQDNLLHRLGAYSASQWLALVYLGVLGTAVGFIWYYQGIRKIGPVKAGQFINFVPISAIVLAYLILNEPVTLSLLAGTLLVTGGVIVVQRAS